MRKKFNFLAGEAGDSIKPGLQRGAAELNPRLYAVAGFAGSEARIVKTQKFGL
jgi:hypothetical protein